MLPFSDSLSFIHTQLNKIYFLHRFRAPRILSFWTDHVAIDAIDYAVSTNSECTLKRERGSRGTCEYWNLRKYVLNNDVSCIFILTECKMHLVVLVHSESRIGLLTQSTAVQCTLYTTCRLRCHSFSISTDTSRTSRCLVNEKIPNMFAASPVCGRVLVVSINEPARIRLNTHTRTPNKGKP